MPEALTREKKHAVVASLARGRSVAMTAERCHVPAGVVQLLRDNYGPDLPRLEAAARELAKAPSASPTSLRPARTPQPSPEPTMTLPTPPTAAVPAATPTPASVPKPSIAGINSAIAAHMDGVTDPRIVKMHERATAAITALVEALDAHRKAAKVNAEIAELEARLAKARGERAQLVGTKKATKAAASGVDAKTVRAWATANGVPVSKTGRVNASAVDAWRAAGSPTT